MHSSSTISRAVFSRDHEDVSDEDIRQLLEKYPWFLPARFLHLSKTGSLAATNTDVFFPNSLWINNALLPAELPAVIETQPVIVSAEEIQEATPAQLEPAGDEEDEEMPIEEDLSGAPLKIPELKIEPLTGNELTFEPFHTVDYFASQGIEAKDEDKSRDRFAIQLKSFTEWLKTMKKTNPADLAAKPAGSDEKQVEKLAEHSINDREVVTEAMAEVWEKQGNYAKAVAVYEKLSLLDPSKNSYFAAKIKQIKP